MSEIKKCRFSIENLSNNLNELSRNTMIQNRYNGKKLVANTDLSESLRACLEAGPKLIFSFNEFSCEACVDYLIEWLEEVSMHIDRKNIVILVMFENEIEANFIRKRLNERYTFLSYRSDEQLFVDRDFKYNPPFVCVLTSDLIISNLYVFSIKFPELNENYLKSVKTNFSIIP